MKTSITSSLSLKNVNLLILSLIVFSLPLNLKFISPLIALYVLSSIVFIGIKKPKFEVKLSNLFLITFYLLLIIGLMWSSNLRSAFFDLEVKLSLLIFPLIFSFIRYSKSELIILLKLFCAGLVISSSLLLVLAYVSYNNSSDISDFFYINLSPKIHPSYLSMYYVVGMSVILVALRNNVFETIFGRFAAVILVVVFFVFNLLLLSKIGIIVSTLILVYFVARYVLINKKFGIGILVVIALSSAFYYSFQNLPYFKQRVVELSDGLNSTSKSNGSTAVRLKIWNTGMKLIAQSLIFGYGTGDVKDALMAEYAEDENYSAYAKKLNAHNQFIQVTVALGIVGFIVFLLALGFLLVEGLHGGNLYTVFFVIASIFYMFPESVLENQAGTIFFGLFFALLNQKSLHETANSNTILSA
ncbi:MAG: O-antigen ligase family protein [Crocinitomicaceae bacterium]